MSCDTLDVGIHIFFCERYYTTKKNEGLEVDEMRLKSVPNVLMAGVIVSMNISLLLHGCLLSGDGALHTSKYGALWDFSGQNSALRPGNLPSTSACLYIMDDNHYLIEWLAYHYHTINLRNLIVTTDPGSLTSPVPVFDRWKHRMDIILWTDHDFFPDDFDQRERGTLKDQTLQYHRARQAAFNIRCLKEHKRLNRGWTMVIDTDEYMAYSPDLSTIKIKDGNETMWKVPPLSEPGSLASILDQMAIPNPYFDEITTPCVPVYRRQFAAKESPESQINMMSPLDFDGHFFQTIRWRKYGWKVVAYETRIGTRCRENLEVPNKVIIDLGRLRIQDLDHPANRGNPHAPMEAICPSNLYLGEEDTPLMVHHYMGTLDQWLYRVGDKRGNGYRLAKYEYMNSRLGFSESSQLASWLFGFVESMGRNEASRLLKGVGVLEPLPHLGGENKASTSAQEETPVYHVGDILQGNAKGHGYWYWAEVSAVLSNGYYNVHYLEDCSSEIAIPAIMLRRNGTADDSEDYDIDIETLAIETADK